MKKVFTKRVVLLVTALTLGCTFHYPVHAETTISQKENVTDLSTNATNELSETISKKVAPAVQKPPFRQLKVVKQAALKPPLQVLLLQQRRILLTLSTRRLQC